MRHRHGSAAEAFAPTALHMGHPLTKEGLDPEHRNDAPGNALNPPRGFFLQPRQQCSLSFEGSRRRPTFIVLPDQPTSGRTR